MPSGQYDRDRSVGRSAIEAARDWLAQPDHYRNLMASGKSYARKYGISLTSISRARVILCRDQKMAEAVYDGSMSLHGATQELIKRGEASLVGLPQEMVSYPVVGAVPAPAVVQGDDRLRRIVDRLAELTVAVERLTARQGALERRLERDEKDGAALNELAVKGIRQSEENARGILRLEAGFARVMAAGAVVPAATRKSEKSDFPKGWRHLSEKKREEWRNGKADKG